MVIKSIKNKHTGEDVCKHYLNKEINCNGYIWKEKEDLKIIFENGKSFTHERIKKVTWLDLQEVVIETTKKIWTIGQIFNMRGVMVEFYTIKQNKLQVVHKKNNYIRMQQLDLNETLELLKSKNLEDSKYRINLNGYSIKTSTDRLKNMICNINNFTDGLTPLFFSIERNLKYKHFHLNLYGINENKDIVMITQDNIKRGVI